MDTIQIDAKKLQLLNDRINQTIDALNQLRVTAQQASAGLGHSTLGGQVSPYAQMAAAFGAQGVPGVFGFPQAGMIDPSIVARQQAMQALMSQWAMSGLGHTSLPYNALQSAFAQALPSLVAQGIPAPIAAQTLQSVLGLQQPLFGAGVAGLGHTSLPLNPLQSVYAQAIPGVVPQTIPAYGVQNLFGWQQPVVSGLGHTTARSPVAELIWGACDPTLRQVEYARAQEANRAWEISQGLGHTTSPAAQASLFGATFGNGAFTAGYSPFVTGYGNASIFR
jgi:hypothetical protein